MEHPRIHINVQYPIGVPRRHGVDIIALCTAEMRNGI